MSFVEVIPNLKLCRSRAWYGNFEDTILHRKFWTCWLLARTTPWEIVDAWRSRCVVFQVVHKHKTIGRLTSWKRSDVEKECEDGKVWKVSVQNVLSFCWAALSSLEPFKVSSNIFRGKSRHQTMFPRKVQVVSAKALFSTHLLQLAAEANFGKHQCSHTKACVDCVDGCNFALCSFLGLVEPRTGMPWQLKFRDIFDAKIWPNYNISPTYMSQFPWNQGSHFPS